MYDDLTYAINGCLFTIYNSLGNPWNESFYEQALDLELKSKGIQSECQKKFQVYYFEQRVGAFRVDLLVENTVIVELKAVPKIIPLHQAQLISYLKGFDKPIGILANFGGPSMEHQTLPNTIHSSTVLTSRFDYDKIKLKNKDRIKDLLFMANRILTVLGPGYLHQVYRRAFFHELKNANIEFKSLNEITATYKNTVLGSKPVHFFIIGNLLLSTVAVKQIDRIMLLKFRNFAKHLKCKQGLIFNFNSTTLDFRYIEL